MTTDVLYTGLFFFFSFSSLQSYLKTGLGEGGGRKEVEGKGEGGWGRRKGGEGMGEREGGVEVREGGKERGVMREGEGGGGAKKGVRRGVGVGRREREGVR